MEMETEREREKNVDTDDEERGRGGRECCSRMLFLLFNYTTVLVWYIIV